MIYIYFIACAGTSKPQTLGKSIAAGASTSKPQILKQSIAGPTASGKLIESDVWNILFILYYTIQLDMQMVNDCQYLCPLFDSNEYIHLK